MSIRIITEPTSEPVTLAEVKLLAKIDGTEHDSLISDVLIPAARIEAEKKTGRKLITQTVEVLYDEFPANEIELGVLPIQSVTSVKYYDTSGTLQTMDSADYVLDTTVLPGFLLPAYGESWPSTYAVANAVVIRLVVGYGAADDVPAPIKHWVTLMAAKEADQGQQQVVVSEFAAGLLDKYRLRWI